MNILSFNVPGVRGSDDADRLSGALRSLQGVQDVVVNVPARLVQVVYDKSQSNADVLKDAIERMGFLVQRYSDGRR